MEASSITTAKLLAVLRVVWPRVWELEASQDMPPLYIVQTYASYPCQCGSPIGICLSPHDACPNKSYGPFIVAQKTPLVTTDSDAAKQCARSALVELLQSECPNYRPTLVEEGTALPSWLYDISWSLHKRGDCTSVPFLVWYEQPGLGGNQVRPKDQPQVLLATVKKARLAGATKAMLRGTPPPPASVS